MTSITNLVCEYRSDPLGVNVTAPRLGRQMQGDRRGARQTAYRILAASDPQRLRKGEVGLWDSGKIETLADDTFDWTVIVLQLGSQS